MQPIIVEVSGRVVGAPDVVCEFFREIDVTAILTGMGPLPAVTGVENASNRWDTPGQQRTLELADGSSLRECMTEVDSPRSFSYDIDRITGPLGMLVTGMAGRWSFEPIGPPDAAGHTLAHWHYAFEVGGWWAWLPSLLIIRFMWRPYMGRVLARAAALASLEFGQSEDTREGASA